MPSQKFMQLPITQTAALEFPASNDTWDAVRYWVGMSIRLKHADLACQVMAGFALDELHTRFAIRPGRPPKKTAREKLPNDSVISTPPWPEIVKREAGISDDTARNWILMAEGVKKRWKGLPIRERLAALMSVPPSQWGEEDAKLISAAVHKATDGRTQLEFMWELGIAKKPQGSGATGRAPGEGGRTKLPLAAEAELAKLQAAERWTGKAGISLALRAYAHKFTCLPDTQIQAQIAELELAIKARKAWLNQPLNQRDIVTVAALFSS